MVEYPIKALAQFFGISEADCRAAAHAKVYQATTHNTADLRSFAAWAKSMGSDKTLSDAINHFCPDERAKIDMICCDSRTINGRTVQTATRKDFTERR